MRKQKQRALIRQDPDKLAEYHLKDRERKALERRMGKNQESDEQRERRRKRDREAKAKKGERQKKRYSVTDIDYFSTKLSRRLITSP